jgi:NTP pyrophosphatase (non-canonical NTP hydrolase)
MNKKITFDQYQKLSNKTAVYPTIGKSFVYPTLGLAGEVGEVVEKVKKAFRDDGGRMTKLRKDEIQKELGDVLWYLAQISTQLKLSFSDVADMNLEKLKSRKNRGTIHGSGDNR